MKMRTHEAAKAASTPTSAIPPQQSGLLPLWESGESDRSLLPSESWQRSPSSPTPIHPSSVGHRFGVMEIGSPSTPMLQRKLAIGQPNDRYEQEADRVADQVMRMPAPKIQRVCPECKEELKRQPIEEEKKKEEEETLQTKPLAETITPLIQRQTEPTEEEKKKKEEETLQTKPLAESIAPLIQRQTEPTEEEKKKKEEETLQTKPLAGAIIPLIQRQMEPTEEEKKKKEEETLQTKPLAGSINPLIQRQTEPAEEEKKDEEETLQTKPASGEASTVSPALQNQITALQGGGQPLSESDRHFFEPRFGTDFSQVRVHADSQAAETARAVNARAFTLGRDVVFGAGEYQPQAFEGKRLLAHELTHVLQQKNDERDQHSITSMIQREEAKTENLQQLRQFLEDGDEEKAITLMGRLSSQEVSQVLASREFKEMAIDTFNNDEMYRGMQAMHGDLYPSLEWMFDEGTDWKKVRGMIASASSGRERVRSDNWMRDQFVSICNDKEMLEAVSLLNGTPAQQADWLAAEGVNAERIYEATLKSLLMPDQANSVFHVLRTLPRNYRDDVAYYFVKNRNDEAIKQLANSPSGRQLLVLILAEIADGWTTGEEKQQRDRITGLVPTNGPDLEKVQQETAEKDKLKQSRSNEATKLIDDDYTSRGNLNEKGLGIYLLNRLPQDTILIEATLDELGSTDRDDVSLELFKAATDQQIQTIASDSSGRLVLLRMVHELFLGDMSNDEREQMQRVMSQISIVDKTKGASVEIEVITFLYGGSLDALGVALADGSKGHTAITIGDRAYSFESGWSCGRTRQEYLASNQLKRDAVGQVLNLPEEDVRKIQTKLDASCGKGAYAISGDICTDSAAQALEEGLTNLKAGWNPQRFVGYLESAKAKTTGQPIVKAHRFYPKQHSKQ